MRLTLKANGAGELRCILARDKPTPSAHVLPVRTDLVGSKLLQDCICVGHFATKPGYGFAPNGRKLSNLARQRLREFGAIADQQPRNRSVFLTGTLPGSTRESLIALAEWSAWVVSRLTQWFRDQYPGALFFGVWEYQRRGALHLHACVTLTDEAEARELKQRWKMRWANLLDGVGRRARTDVWSKQCGGTWDLARWKLRTDASTVEKSVGRYLSKYLSKGNRSKMGESPLPPTSWWFAAKNLRNEAEARRLEMTISNLDPATARDVYERLAGEVAGTSHKVFPMSNVWDHGYSGVMGFMAPAAAGCFIRAYAPLLRTLHLDAPERSRDAPVSFSELCQMFGALKLTNSS